MIRTVFKWMDVREEFRYDFKDFKMEIKDMEKNSRNS